MYTVKYKYILYNVPIIIVFYTVVILLIWVEYYDNFNESIISKLTDKMQDI